MRIERTRHVDASEPDGAGLYEYFYEYDIFRFSDGPTCVVARSYVDEPDEVHFLGIEVEGQRRPMTDADLAGPLLLAARSHLQSIGKTRFNWLSGRGNGYEAVPGANSPPA